jgi:hypothetical protein
MTHATVFAPAVFSMSTLNAGRVAASLEAAEVCEAVGDHTCDPGPGTLLHWRNDT